MHVVRNLNCGKLGQCKSIQIIDRNPALLHDLAGRLVIDRHILRTARRDEFSFRHRRDGGPYQLGAGLPKALHQTVQVALVFRQGYLLQAVAHDLQIVQAPIKMDDIPALWAQPGVQLGQPIGGRTAILGDAMHIGFARQLLSHGQCVANRD